KIKADDVVKEKGIGIGLKAVLIKLGAEMHAQATTREEVRREIKPRLRDLIEKINSIIFNAEEKLNKKILVIIDDLDKLDLKTAEDLYYGYGSLLIQPECKVIYTIPQALLFTTKIMQITTTYFGEPYILPNIKIKEKNEEYSFKKNRGEFN
ncbi:MAG: P-loop NTPase fold protein, partial [Candidatus Aminicenantia bacterium]